MFGEISLAIMLHLLFRRSGPDRIAVYYRHFRFILGRISAMLVYLRPLQANIGPGSPGWWLARDMTRFHATIQEDLDRAASAEPDCVAVRVASNLANAGMSDRALVREQIVSLMLAGHDTVASALSWALLWLLRDPDLLARVRAEIGAAAPLDLSTLETLPLLGAVCNEALRLVPTVELVSRKAMVDFPLGDVVVPAGTLVSPCTYLAHREPGLYPDPDTFRPERFLERDYGPAEFIPFGGGLRRCLGAQLGLLEMRAVLAVALTTVDFDVPGLARIDGVRRNVTIAPSPRMKARVRRRVTPTRNPG
jgi:cytochrome P450